MAGSHDREETATKPQATPAPLWPPGPFVARSGWAASLGCGGSALRQCVPTALTIDGEVGIPGVSLDYMVQPPEWSKALVFSQGLPWNPYWTLNVYLMGWICGAPGQGLGYAVIATAPPYWDAQKGDVAVWVDAWNHLRTGRVIRDAQGRADRVEVVVNPTTTKRQPEDPGIAVSTPATIPIHELFSLVRGGVPLGRDYKSGT